MESATEHILGDPGAVSRDDGMFVAKVYYKIDLIVNFRHEHSIFSTNCPWVSEDALNKADWQKAPRSVRVAVIEI